MTKLKGRSGKLYFSLVACFLAVVLILTFLLVPNTIYAEEGGTSVYESFLAKMIADKHYIGDARLSTYLQLKPSGDGLFMVEGEIQPLINDGSHDYKVQRFSLDVSIFDDLNSMSNITSRDNSTSKIITETNGTSVTITGNGEVSFTFSNTVSMTYDTSSVRANYSHFEELKGVGEIDKEIYIEPIKAQKDTTYSFMVVFFFKYDPKSTNDLNYTVRMKKMQVDGIWFAPDYGVNNNEALYLSGSCNVLRPGRTTKYIMYIGNDGSPNDWIETY